MDRITTMDTSIMDMDTGAMGKLDVWTGKKRSKNVDCNPDESQMIQFVGMQKIPIKKNYLRFYQ